MEIEILKQNSCSAEVRLHAEEHVAKQLADMKDQTEYMKQFRVALGSALDEVKTLRSELAQEKSKGFEVLKTSKRQDIINERFLSRNGNIQAFLQAEGACRQNILTIEAQDQDVNALNTSADISSVIVESALRLDRVRDAIIGKKDLIRSLRKKLQSSTTTLVRRETKLEEKITQGNEYKNQISQLVQERDRLQETLQSVNARLQEETALVGHKENEINGLQRKLSLTENEVNNLYSRLCESDREIKDARTMLWNNSSQCTDCSWMREYVRSLEHKLERYRYASYAYEQNCVNGMSNFDKTAVFREASRPYASNYDNSNRPSSAVDNRNTTSHYWQTPHNKTSKAAAYKRQQAINRQRHQEFRNASQVLSPITEDAEEYATSTDDVSESVSEDDAAKQTDSTFHKENDNLKNKQFTYETNFVQREPMYASSPRSKNAPTYGDRYTKHSYPYFTVQSGGVRRETQIEKMEQSSPTYLHISPVPASSNQSSKNTSHITNAELTVSVKHVSDGAMPGMTSSNHESSSLHGTARKINAVNNEISTSLAISNLTPVRSFPSLNTFSPTPSSVISTTEDNVSDTTGCCSSDSGISKKRPNKKLVKTRRIKRKPNKYITFRNHKIDVTRFSTIDFRQIMWSICTDDKSADEFLNFLAIEAGRLKNDPSWADKHTLGEPEDWLRLKGSY